jgi:copper homeostasis protein CutC
LLEHGGIRHDTEHRARFGNQERLEVPAFIMIRPRGGDFVFDDAELDVMRATSTR